MRLIHWTDPAFDAAAPPGLRARIECLNAFVAPERLRRYQADLLRTGRFEWPDPASGVAMPCSGTLYFGVKAFAWRFASEAGPLWVMTGDPTHGFELAGLLLPDGPLLRFDQYDDRSSADARRQAIADVEGNFAGPAISSALPVRLVVGHENFAHFMWNELPALIEAEPAGQPAAETWGTWEPIAPVERLIHWGPVHHTSANALLAAPGGFHSAVLFAAGATRMSLAASTRVIEACGPAPRTPGRFVVWLSLRLTHRHPLNQLSVFVMLLEALAALPFGIEVILDGYSLPADLDVPGRHHAGLQRRRADEVAALPAQLRDALSHAAAGRLVITDATRESLPASIALAGRADFYVCHHGTQQHKIGWLTATPGVIHALTGIVRSLPAGWTQHQSEISALPTYVPESLIADEPVPDGVDPGWANYRFSDPAGFVAFVLEHLLPVAAASGFNAG